MQIALPRSTEAGSQQQQLNAKPVTDQELAMDQSAKLAENERKRASKTDEADSALIRDEEQQQDREHHESQQKKRKTPADTQEENVHPYKGHHIDLSL